MKERYLGIDHIPKITVFVGFVLMLMELLGSVYGGAFTLSINPIIGLVGVIFSIYKKQWLFLVLNIIVIIGILLLIPLAYLSELF